MEYADFEGYVVMRTNFRLYALNMSMCVHQSELSFGFIELDFDFV